MKNNSTWFENTIINGGKACHPLIGGVLGLSTSVDGFIALGTAVHKEIGFFTGISTAIRGSYWIEKYHLTMLTASIYCGASYTAGGLDAWYQSSHEQRHFGTDVADKTLEWWEDTSGWYDAKEKGVNDFLIRSYEWWKN